MTEINISLKAVARLCNDIATKAAALTEAQAERDAALAEVARLREALTNLLAAVDKYAETQPQSCAEALASADVAVCAEFARAALQETRNE